MVESAIYWGTSSGGGNYRVGISFEIPPTNWAPGQTSHVQRVYAWWRADGRITDDFNNLEMNGTGAISLGAVSLRQGIRRIGQADFTVPIGPAKTQGFNVILSGVEAADRTLTTHVNVTYSATGPGLISPGEIPTPTVERVSDTRHTVKWTMDPGWQARDSHIIQRREIPVGGSPTVWVDRGSAVPSALSWTDTGTVANKAYQWRIVARNSAGLVGGSGSVTVFTSVPAPGSVSAARSGSDIQVTWSAAAGYVAGYAVIVERREIAGWIPTEIYRALVPSVRSYVYSIPDVTKVYRFKVTALRPWLTGSTPPVLESPWSTSNEVAVLAPPNPPTITSPAVGEVLSPGVPFTIRWTHNAPDASAQSSFRIESRTAPLDTTDWSSWGVTYDASSSAEMHTVNAPPSSTQVQYRVRTKGAHPDSSLWATSQVVLVGWAPLVTITKPPNGSVIPGSSVELGVVAVSEDFPVEHLSVHVTEHGGSPVNLQIIPDPVTGTFPEEHILNGLKDGAGYTVQARAAARGLVGIATITFDVVFALPATPEVEVTFHHETGQTSIAIVNPYVVDHPEAVHNELWVGDTFVSEIPPHGSYTDHIPDLTGTTYRIRAVSGLPSLSEWVEVELQPGDPRGFGVHLNYGPDYSQHAWIAAGAPSFSDHFAGDVTLQRWDGDAKPTATFGPGKPFETDIEGMVFFDQPGAARDLWIGLVDSKSLVCLRTRTGMWVGVVADLNITHRSPEWGNLTFRFTEVEDKR